MKIETIKKKNTKKIVIGVISLAAILLLVIYAGSRAEYKIPNSIPLVNGTINYELGDFNTIALYKQKEDMNCTEDSCYEEMGDRRMPDAGYIINEEKSYCNVNGEEDKNAKLYTNANGEHVIANLQKKSKCYLYFDKAKSVVETLIATGDLVEENGWRYQGSDPNNYVLFNGDELWRIIGVFSVTTEARKQENLIKIIRDESIGDILWASNVYNEWTLSDIKRILNGQYYNGEDINYTYLVSDNKTITITGKSLKEDAREKVESVVWNLGGASSHDITTEAMYDAERGETVYSGHSTTWTGYIGLMYPSDYGYASPSSTCPRTTTLYDYDSTGCFDNNWLRRSDGQWTITPGLAQNNAFSIYSAGYAYIGTVGYDYGVSPSLYLKSSVQIINGEGTSKIPYILS